MMPDRQMLIFKSASNGIYLSGVSINMITNLMIFQNSAQSEKIPAKYPKWSNEEHHIIMLAKSDRTFERRKNIHKIIPGIFKLHVRKTDLLIVYRGIWVLHHKIYQIYNCQTFSYDVCD